MTKAAVPVHCAHTRLCSIDDLRPNPKNPNRHSDRQIALLAKIIKHQGWRNSIVVSQRSGLITKGHARLAAAQLLGLEHAPVDDQPYRNDAEEWQDMIADNKIAELSELDPLSLKGLLDARCRLITRLSQT